MTVTKRFTAPKFWNINVKETKYVVSPTRGPHSKNACIPLSLALRDILHHAEKMSEARSILNAGIVKVNGIVRKERGFPIGLMDVIEIDGEFHRVIPSSKGLTLFATKAEDAKMRTAKIVDKRHVGKKKIQLCLHDGSNMLVEKDEYKTSDVIILEEGKIKHHVKFDKGAHAIVTDGNNAGLSGKIHSIDRKLKTVVLTAGDKNVIVPIKYIFVTGHEKPLVNIG